MAIVMLLERIGRRRREPFGLEPGADRRVAQPLDASASIPPSWTQAGRATMPRIVLPAR